MSTSNNHEASSSNTIKKPISAYMFFCKYQRDIVKTTMEEAKQTKVMAKDIMVELGIRWNKIKWDRNLREEYKKYNDMATDDRQRYANQLNVSKGIKVTKDKDDDDDDDDEDETTTPKRKRESSSYVFYCQETRICMKIANPDMKGIDVTKKLATMWKAMSITDKQVWEDKANP